MNNQLPYTTAGTIKMRFSYRWGSFLSTSHCSHHEPCMHSAKVCQGINRKGKKEKGGEEVLAPLTWKL